MTTMRCDACGRVLAEGERLQHRVPDPHTPWWANKLGVVCPGTYRPVEPAPAKAGA